MKILKNIGWWVYEKIMGEYIFTPKIYLTKDGGTITKKSFYNMKEHNPNLLSEYYVLEMFIPMNTSLNLNVMEPIMKESGLVSHNTNCTMSEKNESSVTNALTYVSFHNTRRSSRVAWRLLHYVDGNIDCNDIIIPSQVLKNCKSHVGYCCFKLRDTNRSFVNNVSDAFFKMFLVSTATSIVMLMNLVFAGDSVYGIVTIMITFSIFMYCLAEFCRVCLSNKFNCLHLFSPEYKDYAIISEELKTFSQNSNS